MRFALVLAVSAACGPREVAPVDYGPPPAPGDPIACPAATLERFAAQLGGAIELATEPIADTSRVDKLPCKPAETDDACVARGRRRAVPSGYVVTGVAIGGDVAHVEFDYDIDGRRVTERADSMAQMVARIKALQARGHAVTLIRGESAPDAGSRHAAISYRGTGGRERRIATVRVRPDAGPDTAADVMADARAHAEASRLELRRLEVDDRSELVIVVTCLSL